MTSREARRAAEAAAKPAKMTQAEADAMVARLIAGKARSKVSILAVDGNTLTCSEAGRWDSAGLRAVGTLADGRRWDCRPANSWGDYSIVIG